MVDSFECFFKSFICFVKIYFYYFVGCSHVCRYPWRYQIPQDLELWAQTVVNQLLQVLGTEHGSFERTASALNHWAMCPAPKHLHFILEMTLIHFPKDTHQQLLRRIFNWRSVYILINQKPGWLLENLRVIQRKFVCRIHI